MKVYKKIRPVEVEMFSVEGQKGSEEERQACRQTDRQTG